MLEQVGVAFLGAGMVSELHARALRGLPEATLVGVFDPDMGRADARSHEWRCVRYLSVDDVLADPAVEGVMILSPFDTHEALATRCLEAGKHVLVEKPVAPRDGIRRLLRLAESKSLVCMPGHNYAYQPEFRKLRHLLVKEKAFGDVRALWVTYAIRHPETVAAAYGGVMEEVMIHHTYLALALLGPPTRIHAGRSDPAWEQLRQEDQAWMTWEYDSGISAHLFATFAVDDETADPWTFVVKALGTRGGGTYSWRSFIYDRPLGTLARAIPAYEDSYIDQDAAFIAAVRGNTSRIVSPLDHALKAAELMDAALRASVIRAAVPCGPGRTTAMRGE